MKFILVLFTNKDFNNPCVIGFAGFKLDAEKEAENHLKEHPEDAVHIYEWAVGYEAITRIDIDRQWYCPQLPEQLPEPTPEPEDEPMPTIEEVREQL